MFVSYWLNLHQVIIFVLKLIKLMTLIKRELISLYFQGFFNAVGGNTGSLMPSPVFRYNKPFPGLTTSLSSRLKMAKGDRLLGGQAGSFYHNDESARPLSPLPRSIIGHLLPSAAEMQVCIGRRKSRRSFFSVIVVIS